MPSYCEPTYWIGLTRFNMDDAREGVAALREALTCKYVAAEALKALNTIYAALHAQAPEQPVVLAVRVLALVCVSRRLCVCAVRVRGTSSTRRRRSQFVPTVCGVHGETVSLSHTHSLTPH